MSRTSVRHHIYKLTKTSASSHSPTHDTILTTSSHNHHTHHLTTGSTSQWSIHHHTHQLTLYLHPHHIQQYIQPYYTHLHTVPITHIISTTKFPSSDIPSTSMTMVESEVTRHPACIATRSWGPLSTHHSPGPDLHFCPSGSFFLRMITLQRCILPLATACW